MISISFEASCLRMPNINSCLRMVEAFSTSCSSANASNSTGFLDFKSWSFSSAIAVVLGREIEDAGFDQGRREQMGRLLRRIRSFERAVGRETGFHCLERT